MSCDSTPAPALMFGDAVRAETLGGPRIKSPARPERGEPPLPVRDACAWWQPLVTASM